MFSAFIDRDLNKLFIVMVNSPTSVVLGHGSGES